MKRRHLEWRIKIVVLLKTCPGLICKRYMHDFQSEHRGLRVWNAFQVGPGKLIPWDEIYATHQGATDLMIEEGNFEFAPRKFRGCSRDGGDAESSKEAPVFECPDPACPITFKSVEDMELHISVGHCAESVYDKLKRDWVEKFASLTLLEGACAACAANKKESGAPYSSNLCQGWALHELKGGPGRFPEKVRQYLTSKFDIGVKSGRKEDPGQVAQDMRKAKTENGDRLISRDEWLTKSQVQGSSRDCHLQKGKNSGAATEHRWR